MRFCPFDSVACYRRDARTISGKSTTKSGMVSTLSVEFGNHFSMECAIVSLVLPNGVTL